MLRAVLLSGAGFCLIGLLGLGLGAIIRHTAAAIAVVVAVTFVVSIFIRALSHGAVARYMPVGIVANSLSVTKPLTCGGRPARARRRCPPGPGSACCACTRRSRCVIGGWLLARRDA